MLRIDRTGVVLTALVLLGWPQTGRADFVFSSQPIQGHVLDFWIGISPANGSGSLVVDMKNPANPSMAMAGTTGRHIIRLGLNLDGVGILPDLNPAGELPELVGGNPAGYTFSYLDGAIRLRFDATTSPGGQLLEDPAYDSYSQAQPGFPTAGWTTFLVTGTGLSSDFDVTVFGLPGTAGIQSEVQGQTVTWNDVREVTPVTRTPEPGSAVLLAVGAVTWLGLRRRGAAQQADDCCR